LIAIGTSSCSNCRNNINKIRKQRKLKKKLYYNNNNLLFLDTFAGFLLVESILPAIATADFIFLAFPAAAAFKPVAVLLVVV
jgi:hypothetical protein